jgi:haloacetate dehalogenase
VFDGFELTEVRGLRMRRGGSGTPVLLLHGHPQTHAMWNAVAPLLAADHTVVAADLPGYGGSRAVRSGSKREMAQVLVAAMRELGFDRFAVAGHDRGGRCAYASHSTTPTASSGSRCSTSCRRPRCGAAPTRNSASSTGTGSSSHNRSRFPSG